MRYRPHAVHRTCVLYPTLSASEQAVALCELYCSPALAPGLSHPPQTSYQRMDSLPAVIGNAQDSFLNLEHLPSEETTFNPASENYSSACESRSSSAHSKSCSTKSCLCSQHGEGHPRDRYRHHGKPVGAGLLQARARKVSSSPARPGAPRRKWSPQGFPCKGSSSDRDRRLHHSLQAQPVKGTWWDFQDQVTVCSWLLLQSVLIRNTASTFQSTGQCTLMEIWTSGTSTCAAG